MDKKKLWIIIAAAAAVLVIVVVTLCALFWPGYRVVGDKLYVDIQKTGFVFDPETGEILGETPVKVSGTADSADGGDFEGEILVLSHQNMADGTVTGTAGTEKTDDGFVLIHYIESCTHYETVEFESGYEPENDVTKKVEHICDYYYTVCLYPEDGDFAAVEVGDYAEETLVYVICAEDEAEAKERYQWYVENR